MSGPDPGGQVVSHESRHRRQIAMLLRCYWSDGRKGTR